MLMPLRIMFYIITHYPCLQREKSQRHSRKIYHAEAQRRRERNRNWELLVTFLITYLFWTILLSMSDNQSDKNLLVVVAVEEYARRHKIPAHEALDVFLKFGITESIRQCYETLHTQDIYESVSFAEDIIARKNV